MERELKETAAEMRKERLKRLATDAGMELFAVSPGAIHVLAAASEPVPLDILKPAVVRIGNMLAVTDMEKEPVQKMSVRESIEISSDDVEVFYMSGADPTDYGVMPVYRSIQIYDIEFKIISDNMKDFIKTVMF